MNDENKYLELLKLSTIPLKKLDKKHMPINVASSCVVQYKGRIILLTVQHATGDMGNWVAEVRYDKSRGGMGVKPLGSMNFLRTMSLNNTKFKDIDFSYVELPNDFESYYQHIEPTGFVHKEVKRLINPISFHESVNKEDTYGFFGQILTKRLGMLISSTPVLYSDLKYKGDDGDYLMFELPTPHKGHKYFRGCSGSPIISRKGEIVALVCYGDIEKNIIYGVSLKKYKVAIDATFSHIGN